MAGRDEPRNPARCCGVGVLEAALARCRPAPPPDRPTGYAMGGRVGEWAGTATVSAPLKPD